MDISSKNEQISLEDLQRLQLRRLKKTVLWAEEKSSFYREKFLQADIHGKKLKHLDDIRSFPFTTKQEYMTHSPYDFLTLPLSRIVRICLWEHPEPVVKMYTDNDIARNLEAMLRLITAAGVNRTSVIGIIGDLADSGLMDIQYACEFIGASVVMLSSEYERALKLMDSIGVDTLIGSSRRILQLIVAAQANGKDITEYTLRSILCLNDTIQNPLEGHIANRTNTEVVNLFSSSIFGSSGMMYQCEERYGSHFQADIYYPELVMFGSDEVIEGSGQMGELVVTTLMNEAMPLIRYRTGQTAMRVDEPCACGRTLPIFVTPFGKRNK